MNFPLRIVLVLSATLGFTLILPAQDAATPPPKPSNAPKPIELAISPAPPSVPAFRDRLLPRASDRTPGDAAPIYLRLGAELDEAMRRQLSEKPLEWLQLPLDKFPTAEARALVDSFAARLKQIEYGARRRTCDWNYTIPEERGNAFELQLPDIQDMRQWGRLVALKARVEIAEGKFAEAAKTIETGLAFARHVGEGPYYMNALVGIAMAYPMLDRVDEWAGRPGAPSLYWPLTALPRPLIPSRDATENEQKSLDGFIPELDDLDRARTEGEWSALLARVHAKLAHYQRLIAAGGPGETYDPKPLDLAWFKANLLQEARNSAQARPGSTDGQTDDQRIVLHVADRYREFRDDLFKGTYLPITDAGVTFAEAERKNHALKPTPLGVFARFAPAVIAMRSSESRLDRRVAALRVVEAIRLQAQLDGGRLPDSLDKVKAVPVPLDPTTGRPFEYRHEGDLAILTGPRVNDVGYVPEITYRLRAR